jgi:amylosucrase
VEDRDASAVGLSGPEHRAFLSDFYSGLFPGSFAEGLVFQFNPDTGDRRISGATASLAGLGTALRDADPDRARDAVARILLAHAIILLWGGIPVLWSGDEIGTLNDEGWGTEPTHTDDNRWAHRPRLDWDLVRRLAAEDGPDYQGAGDVFPEACLTPPWPEGPVDHPTAAALVFGGLRRLIATRQSLPHLHASVAAEASTTSDPGVLAVRRPHPLGTVLGLFNVTESPRIVPLGWLHSRGVNVDSCVDALSGGPPARDEGGFALRLPSYGVVWLMEPI